MRCDGSESRIPTWSYFLIIIPFSLFYFQFKQGYDVNGILQTKYSLPQTQISSSNETLHINIQHVFEANKKPETNASHKKNSKTLATKKRKRNEVELNLETHGDQSAKPIFGNSESTVARSENGTDECGYGPFYIPTDIETNCFVRAPQNYTQIYDRKTRLWMTSAENLGVLNTSVPDYHNQVYNQRWLRIRKGRVLINKKGGTSVRKFGDNFEYFNLLMNHTNIFNRCKNASKPTILDTGAGISSVAAAARDATGGNGYVSVLSYVPVDDYLRLGTIISDRGLPVYLHYYTGERIPAPDSSFDMIHCRWCWHHVVGYDTWLSEVNRLLVPGGVFVFTFVPKEDEELLPKKPWLAALNRMPWKCKRTNKIVQICTKIKEDSSPDMLCGVPSQKVPEEFERYTSKAWEIIHGNSASASETDRVLNLDCVSADMCHHLEKKLAKQNMLHTFRNDSHGREDLRKMINSGSLGVLHNWEKPGPFYPRMFDVVYLSCLKLKSNLEALFFEIHRLLRPDGFVFAVKTTCPQLELLYKYANESKFHIVMNDEDVFVGQRINF